MKIEINYVYGCKDGFRFIRSTPQEVLELFENDYKELCELATGKGDFCNYFIDTTNKYFPKGSISVCIDGCYKFYELKTEVAELC